MMPKGSSSTFIFLWCIIILVSADSLSSREANHEEVKLHKELLSDYLSDYRPVKDHKNTVTVKVRFALKYISFDSLEETMTVHSWVALTWKDEFLKWTPSDYGDIAEIQLESHEIWTPRLSLFNADASIDQWDRIYTTCLVTNDGAVTCVPQLAHSGICRTSLRRWPYDSQNCTMYFGSWMHTGEQVNFTFYNNKPVVLDDYQNGPGWKLLNVLNERIPGNSYSLNSSYPMLKYKFILKREAAGPAAVVVIPSIVIVMLTLTTLLLDIKDNTRLILACFSLFGHFTFLTEIGYEIPKHSSETPILLLFLRDSMIMSLVAILLTLVLMALRRKVLPAPTWIITLNRLVSSGPGKYVIFTEFDPSNVADVKILTEDSDGANVEQRAQEVSDWIKFANMLNSGIFIISCVVYIVLIIGYIPLAD